MNSAKAIQDVQHCPKCDSPAPHLHPAIQFEGEVQPCNHAFHLQITPQNTPAKIADAHIIRDEKEREKTA